MATPKYKSLINKAFAENTELFQHFIILNNDYQDKSKRKDVADEFQKIGEEVKFILEDLEDELCSFAEREGHPTDKLSEKFWNEVRKYFSMIDQVGVIVKFQ